jgi:hypothetical protein
MQGRYRVIEPQGQLAAQEKAVDSRHVLEFVTSALFTKAHSYTLVIERHDDLQP